ncbi:MAG: hypothetical protein WA102_01205 [Candidatus Methanoperedens sp.]
MKNMGGLAICMLAVRVLVIGMFVAVVFAGSSSAGCSTFLPAPLIMSSTPTTVTVGTPTSVTFTVTSGGTAASGATVTLSGAATGTGTTDSSGNVVISVNAATPGTIFAQADLSGCIPVQLFVNVNPQPTLSVAATPTTVTVGTPTSATFTVTSGGTAVSGATVTLTGSSTGTGTTDGSGKVVISVNAATAGTITAAATKTGYTTASTTLTANIPATLSVTAAPTTVTVGTPTSTPVLSVSQDPFSFDFGTMNAGESSSQVFTISNNGGGTLTWGVSDDQPWITLDPPSGTNLGTVTINVNTAGLSPGSHSGTIILIANGVSKKGIISLNIASTSIPTQTQIMPIPPSPIPLNQIMGVILVLAGLVFTSLTTIKKDVTLELGVSEKRMKYVGGGGILLIMIGAYILLRSSGLT